MYNKFLFVNKKLSCFLFFLKILRIRNRKMKFRKCKDQKNVRVGKHKGWKMYGLEEYGKVWK